MNTELLRDDERFLPLQPSSVELLRQRIIEEREKVTRLSERILKYENDEASVCPEDVGFVEKIKALEAELAEARKAISDALNTAGGRWCEWGGRAESVRDIINAAMKKEK